MMRYRNGHDGVSWGLAPTNLRTFTIPFELAPQGARITKKTDPDGFSMDRVTVPIICSLRSHAITLLLASVAASSLTACPRGSQGVILETIDADASFVTVDKQLNALSADQGTVVTLTTKGALGEALIPTGYSIEAATRDGSLLALGNSNTDRFVFAPGVDAAPYEVAQVRGLGSATAISPDGARVAISLHEDYNDPMKQGVEYTDDAIYMVDVQTREVSKIPASQEGWVLDLAWEEQDTLYMRLRSPETPTRDTELALDLTSQERREVSWPETVKARSWRHRPDSCQEDRLGSDDKGLYVSTPASAREYLISVQGRERGFHDHFDTIPSYMFVGDCDHVVFVHDQKLYIHQRSSSRTALLGQGLSEPWMFPEER